MGKVENDPSKSLPFQITCSFLTKAQSPREKQTKKNRFTELLEKMDKIELDPQPDRESSRAHENNESQFVYCENSWINNLNQFNRFDNYPLHVDDALTSFRQNKRVYFFEPDPEGPFCNVVPGQKTKTETTPKKISFLQFLDKESNQQFFFDDHKDEDSFDSDANEDRFGFAPSKTPNECFLENLLDENDK